MDSKKFQYQSFLTLLLLSQVLFLSQGKQIFIDYGQESEGKALFPYFHDVDYGFFVDIGSYDPIFLSNTMPLRAQGWTGINIDASASRTSNFLTVRPDDINIFTAIGETDEYVTLYEISDDSSSTISKNVQEFQKQRRKVGVNAEIKVPSMDMKQLCERFYPRKPLFMTLDIEGYGAKALAGNNWELEKCKPEVLLSEWNNASIASGFGIAADFLAQKGYKKMGRVGKNEIFVDVNFSEKYEKKIKEGEALLNNKRIVTFPQVSDPLFYELKAGRRTYPHYSVAKEGIFFHFCKKAELVNLEEIRRESFYYSNKNRPIAIFHFNTNTETLVVPDESYKLQKLAIRGFDYFKVTVKNTYSVYILDHKNQPITQPKIITLKSPQKPLKVQASDQIEIREVREVKEDYEKKLQKMSLEMKIQSLEREKKLIEMKSKNQLLEEQNSNLIKMAQENKVKQVEKISKVAKDLKKDFQQNMEKIYYLIALIILLILIFVILYLKLSSETKKQKKEKKVRNEDSFEDHQKIYQKEEVK